MAEPVEKQHKWIEAAKQRGLGGALMLLLDVLEPIGPLGAQVLYIVQPVSGILGWRHMVGEIAEALEEPGGIDTLRQELAQDSDDE